MTDTIAERKLAIAVEALQRVRDSLATFVRESADPGSEALAALFQADEALQAARRGPPQPDLAEIGERAFCEKSDGMLAGLRRAYAAMRAADEAGRRSGVEADPRVRELREAIVYYLDYGGADWRRSDVRLRAALAAFETEAKP